MIQQNSSHPREDRNWSSSSRNRSPPSRPRYDDDRRRDDYYASSSRRDDIPQRSRYSESSYIHNETRRRQEYRSDGRRSPSPSYRSGYYRREERQSERTNDTYSRHEYERNHQSNHDSRRDDIYRPSDPYHESETSRRRADEARNSSYSYDRNSTRQNHDSPSQDYVRSYRASEEFPRHTTSGRSKMSKNGYDRRNGSIAADDDDEDGLQQIWRRTNGSSSTRLEDRSESGERSHYNDRRPVEKPSLATKVLEEGKSKEKHDLKADLNDDTARQKYVESVRRQIEEKTQKNRDVRSPKESATETVRRSQDSTGKSKRDVIKPSFSQILLPHLLLQPENEKHVPLNSKGEKMLSFRLTYDPELDKEKDKRHKNVMYTKLAEEATDPRNRQEPKRKARKELRLLGWRWDHHSTRPKPPPPPRSIVISGLSPMTVLSTVKRFFVGFGRIDESEIKIDASGMSTGVCYLSFHHDFDDDLKPLQNVNESKAQRGDLIAKMAKVKMNGQKIDSAIVSIEFDDTDRTKFRKTYRDLIQKKLDAAKAASERSYVKATNETSQLASTPSMPPPETPKGPKNMLTSHHLNGRVGLTPPKPLSPLIHNKNGETGKRSSHGNVLEIASREAGFTSTKHIHTQLDDIGQPYAFVKRVEGSTIGYEMICKKFADLRPLWIKSDARGFYIAFDHGDGADRARKVLNGTSAAGYQISVEVQHPRDRSSSRRASQLEEYDRRRDSTDRKTEPKNLIPEKTTWSDEELLEDSRLLLMRELGNTFVRDLRTRILTQFVQDLLQTDRSCGKAFNQAISNLDDKIEEELEIDLNAEWPKSFNRAAKEERRRKLLRKQKEAEEAAARELEKGTESVSEDGEEEKGHVDIQDAKGLGKKTKKVSAKEKKNSAEEKPAKTTKMAKKITRPPSPLPDPFISGLAEEEEDLYFCRIALEMMQEGEDIQNLPAEEDEWQVTEGDQDGELFPPHASGCARTEGFYRIPPAEKGKHLADRNMGTSTEWVASTTTIVNPIGLASARDNRADSRRFVQGIEQHKKETATDTDILKFNQLRSRKKQLKFAKSPIHDWGLYAMEAIPAGDMVIEYVGEIVRQQVADEREKNYERQGNFSTYLFRVDDDIVVDATKKGNIARLMNHCCTPNCNAKILTLNGEKRIVLYAKQLILPGQELTYDYKFQATGDEEDAIACLCGSPGCRRFL